MKLLNSRILAVGIGFSLLASFRNTQGEERPQDKQKNGPARQQVKRPVPGETGARTGGSGGTNTHTPATPSNGPLTPRSATPTADISAPSKSTPSTSGASTQNKTAPGGPGTAKSITPASGPATQRTGNPIGSQTTPAARVNSRISQPPSRTPPLVTKETSTGLEKVAPSGMVREKVINKPNGEQQVQHIGVTGQVQKEEVRKADGTVHATTYDLGHREKKVEVAHRDGTKETTDVHYNRSGEVRARETVKVDAKGAPVAKTVVVKNNLVINNTTVVNNTTVINNRPPAREYHREYVRARYGFVYTPLVIAPVVYAGWYDPYWYAPPLVVGGPFVAIRTHGFRFSWGWEADPWYVYHRAYWEPYPVYSAPSFWVTDWMVAGYLADRYAVAASAEQTRVEANLAREEAAKARLAAEQAKEGAEIAEARAAAAAAEARAASAEARAAKAETAEARRKELAGKPNPKATPVDKENKDALNSQIEKTIAEKKIFADEVAKGGHPIPPDVSLALADPNHRYIVSKTISVLTVEEKPAGSLTGGDMLKLEPGQEAALKAAQENDLVAMKVISSKGEDDEVPAGVTIKIPLKELQEFDNEFRAKLDQGLELAAQNKDQFKNGVAQ
jgi:hypothetical protein